MPNFQKWNKVINKAFVVLGTTKKLIIMKLMADYKNTFVSP